MADGAGSRGPVATKRWTRKEYHALAEAGILSPEVSVELIEGEIIEVTPQGRKHAATVMKVLEVLRHHVPEGHSVRCQLPLALGSDSEPEPDLASAVVLNRTSRGPSPDCSQPVVQVVHAVAALQCGGTRP